MHARMTEVTVLPGKMKAFAAAVESTVPMLRKQEGFRALLVLQISRKDPAKAMILSVWDSLADLKASEKNLFLYQALSRVMKHSKGFPNINECEVLLTEFAAD
jgi:heme-degrading monooxygenase HmoA